jgi:hypothetical protein
MSGTTTDRGDVLHFAGFHHLSPALDGEGKPAFSAGQGDGLTRCGWEAFFHALGRHRLAVARDAEAGTASFVPAGEPTPHARPGEGGLGHAVEHSKRFWRALFPPRPPSTPAA